MSRASGGDVLASGYRFSDAAYEDLVDIWAYGLATWGESRAKRYVGGLRAACERLVTHPEIGPALEGGHGVRSWLHGQHRILYRVVEDVVVIGRVVHQAQDLVALLGE